MTPATKRSKVEAFGSSVRLTDPRQVSVTVTFDHPVREVLSSNDVFIVRTEPPPGTVSNENVFGLSSEGDRLWQISQTARVYPDSPYTKISIEPDGSLWAHNWDGGSCRLNPLTGSILEMRAGK